MELKQLGLDPDTAFSTRDKLGYALNLRVIEITTPKRPTGASERATFARVWNPPRHGNLDFASREDDLRRLPANLRLGRPAALVGLGGVGKTQLASAYAHR